MFLAFTIRVEYDVTDEAALREAEATAAAGFGISEGHDGSGDAATRLLLLSIHERLTVPGTRVVGATLTRDHHLEG